jgi:adenine-specific DNA-methyltransferase
MSKQKLELTWVGKDVRPRLEPRVLLEDVSKSYTAAHRVSENDIFENKLIFGDNLLALKALEQELAGQVKCIFIDPPYNTGSAFEHYDDGLEHSLWLSMMRDRLELLKTMLSDDGSIWITLDDSEAHYAKVLCDELFGRNNFLSNVIWERSDSPRMDAQFFSSRHDHLLVFAKNRESFAINKILFEQDDMPKHYDKVSEDGRKYYLKPLRSMGAADSRVARPTMYFALRAPDGTQVFPKRQDGTDGRWRWNKEKVQKENDRIEWINGRNGWTPNYRIYADTSEGRPPETIWSHVDVGSNRTSKNEIKKLFSDVLSFDTPKPEALIERVISLATNKGDLVLDSFAGSGTTGAVAHKMGRRWIMVEVEPGTPEKFIVPRLRKVIDGTDAGGITQSVGWQGGGGFRYYHLAPTLIIKDRFGQEIINPAFNAEMLAEAVCKLEGFTYSPSSSQEEYWMHGRSTERDFIYVTTQHLSSTQLQVISDDVGEERTLLVMCSAFDADPDGYPNLTVKKIPQSILHKCEWGKDDYSLRVSNLPMLDPSTEESLEAASVAQGKGSSRRKKREAGMTSLFDADGEA